MLKKIYKKISSLIRKNLVFIFLSSLIIIAWHKILFQYFMGEGAVYVVRGAGNNVGYDIGAALQFKVFTMLFRDNMFLYQLWVLMTFILISIFFYKLVHELTENKIISFSSTVFFSLNYPAEYQMLSDGNLENYAQRVIFFLLLFPSLTFFIIFLKRGIFTIALKKYKQRVVYFLLLFPSLTFFIEIYKEMKNNLIFSSFLLFSIAIFFGEYTMYFLFFYFTYFMGYIFFNKKSLKDILKLSFYALFFPLATGIVMFIDKLYGGGTLAHNTPDGGLYYFLFEDTFNTYNETLKQLIILSIPEKIIKGILTNLSILSNNRLHFGYIGTDIKIFYFPVVGIYLFAIFLVAKLKRALLLVVVSSFVYMFFVLMVNVYMRKEIITHTFEQSRYLFGPSIGFAVFWGTALYVVIYKKINRLLFFSILAAWAFINIFYLWEEIDYYFFIHKGMKTSMNYIKSLSTKFTDDSIVITPSILGPYNTGAAKLFYGKQTMFFQPYYADWEKYLKRPFDPKKDFIIIYDYKKGIINRTKDIKKILDERKRGIYPNTY